MISLLERQIVWMPQMQESRTTRTIDLQSAGGPAEDIVILFPPSNKRFTPTQCSKVRSRKATHSKTTGSPPSWRGCFGITPFVQGITDWKVSPARLYSL